MSVSLYTHHETKQGGVSLSDSKESYNEKSVLQVSFFFHLFVSLPITTFKQFYGTWSIYIFLPYLYDYVLFFSYTLVWKMCACWVGTSLSLICLFLFPVRSDIHKKRLKSQHVLANTQSSL